MRKPLPLADAAAMLQAAGDSVPLPPACVAALLNKPSVATLDKMRCEGRGPRWVKIGGRVAYPAGEVRKYLAGLKIHSVA